MGALKYLYVSITIISTSTLFPFIECSNGDRSYIFLKCVDKCEYRNCTNHDQFLSQHPGHLKFFGWDCTDECEYTCMWHTVDAFQKDGSGVPQFYGKWPFIRLAGIQEPASMVFSLLNALSHLAIFYYRARVPSSANMYFVWHGMALVSSGTWLCATLFHTRDTPFTERLDYFSAFALVLYNVFSLLCKILGPGNSALRVVAIFPCLGLYLYHVNCLLHHFDYGYNMKVNITVGALNAFGWIAWCYYERKNRPHVWKSFLTILGLNFLLMLEIGDFPPFFWVFDAHAIWHAGTVPLNFLWYSFIIDDSLYDLAEKGEEEFRKMI